MKAAFITMDKLPENSIKVENKLVRWFRNYWYYYKWWFFAAIFAVVVLSVLIGQSCSRTDSVIKIVYGGTYPPSGNAVPGMEDALSAVIPDDYAEDGVKSASLIMFHYYTDEQIAQTQKDNPLITIDKNNNRQELGKFKDSVVSNDAFLCLVDPSLYDVLDEMGLVTPLSEILGYTPENAVEGKAIRLSDTEFGQYFAGFAELPETYICVRKPSAIQSSTGKGTDSHAYQLAVATFKSIISYKAPEEN